MEESVFQETFGADETGEMTQNVLDATKKSAKRLVVRRFLEANEEKTISLFAKEKKVESDRAKRGIDSGEFEDEYEDFKDDLIDAALEFRKEKMGFAATQTKTKPEPSDFKTMVSNALATLFNRREYKRVSYDGKPLNPSFFRVIVASPDVDAEFKRELQKIQTEKKNEEVSLDDWRALNERGLKQIKEKVTYDLVQGTENEKMVKETIFNVVDKLDLLVKRIRAVSSKRKVAMDTEIVNLAQGFKLKEKPVVITESEMKSLYDTFREAREKLEKFEEIFKKGDSEKEKVIQRELMTNDGYRIMKNNASKLSELFVEVSPKKMPIYDFMSGANAAIEQFMVDAGVLRTLLTADKGSGDKAVFSLNDGKVAKPTSDMRHELLTTGDPTIIGEDIKELEVSMSEVVELGPISIYNATKNIKGLGVKRLFERGKYFSERGQTREDILEVLEELIEELVSEAPEDTQAVFRAELMDIFEEFKDYVTEFDDYSEAEESFKTGGKYIVPYFILEDPVISTYYKSVKTEAEQDIFQFLDGYVDFFMEERRRQRLTSKETKVSPLTEPRVGATKGRTFRGRQTGQEVEGRRTAYWISPALSGVQRKLNDTETTFGRNLNKFMDETYTEVLNAIENIGIDIPDRLKNHPFRKLGAASDEESKFRRQVERRGGRPITGKQLRKIRNFFNVFKTVGEERTYQFLQRKGREAGKALIRYNAVEDADEKAKVFNQISSIIQNLTKDDSPRKSKMRGATMDFKEALEKLNVTEPRQVDLLQRLVDRVDRNKSEYEFKGEPELNRIVDEIVSITKKSYENEFGEEKEAMMAKSILNKRILEVHDTLRILKSEPIYYSKLDTGDFEDVIKMQEHLQIENLDITALEIEGIVKSISSFKEISRDYGIPEETVYKIKAHFR